MRAGLGVGDKAACRFSHQGRKEERQVVGPFGRSGEHVCNKQPRYGCGVSVASNYCVRSRLLN